MLVIIQIRVGIYMFDFFICFCFLIKFIVY